MKLVILLSSLWTGPGLGVNSLPGARAAVLETQAEMRAVNPSLASARRTEFKRVKNKRGSFEPYSYFIDLEKSYDCLIFQGHTTRFVRTCASKQAC